MTTNDAKYGAAMFQYNYALKSADGRYYTGKAGAGWLGEKHEAFTYTEAGAHNKITFIPFNKLEVVRVN